MLDNPQKTQRLLAELKSALPFEVELAPVVAKQLRDEHVAAAERSSHIVSDVSYAGDEGGIVCHIVPPEGRDGIVISLTYVRLPRFSPLAAAILDYQKHRVKKIKKQGY